MATTADAYIHTFKLTPFKQRTRLHLCGLHGNTPDYDEDVVYWQ